MSDDLVKQLRDWRRAMYNTGWVHLADSMEAVADHIEELEGNLAKAVEALGKLADCVDDGCFCSEIEMATAMDHARTALAELEDKTDG